MILFIKHISIEGPGTIGMFFEELNRPMKIIELGEGEGLPAITDDIGGVVILGGPMNVYEEDRHPYLIEENSFIQKLIDEEIPILGICLGSQLIAKACGARVKKSPVKEHGWAMVDQTQDGDIDPLFDNVGKNLIAFQWHEDSFELPKGATLLSTSNACPHQAFKVGKNAYGLQYHIEVTPAIIESWIKKYYKLNDARDSNEGKKMLDQYEQLGERFNRQAQTIYQNFESIIERRKSQKIKA